MKFASLYTYFQMDYVMLVETWKVFILPFDRLIVGIKWCVAQRVTEKLPSGTHMFIAIRHFRCLFVLNSVSDGIVNRNFEIIIDYLPWTLHEYILMYFTPIQ